METIEIGTSGIIGSRIALGTWAIGGWMWGGSTDVGESVETIRSAIARGITLIDTAPVYGFGRSEAIVGKALSAGLRTRAVIATKGGLEWQGGKVWRNSSPERIRQEVEESLRRLSTDYIDLYQVHWPGLVSRLGHVGRRLGKLGRGTVDELRHALLGPGRGQSRCSERRAHALQIPARTSFGRDGWRRPRPSVRCLTAKPSMRPFRALEADLRAAAARERAADPCARQRLDFPEEI